MAIETGLLRPAPVTIGGLKAVSIPDIGSTVNTDIDPSDPEPELLGT
jgi:hypothetical protein